MTPFTDPCSPGLFPEDLQPLAAFRDESVHYRFCLYDTVGSTNDTALRLAREGAPHGTVVIADSQQDGRGRRGRSWHSPPGVNIYMSIILKPGEIAFHPSLVTLSASLAAAEAVSLDLFPRAGTSAWPKWPNDVYCRGRKLGGILTEAVFAGDRIGFLVTGIGLNVNMQAADIPEDFRDGTTSVCIETGEPVERARVVRNTLGAFTRYYSLLFSDPSAVVADWCSVSRTIGSYVKAVTPQGILYGTAEGLDENGFLRLRRDDGEELSLSAAEIVHLRDHDG
ncbi:MAG: biotin--[acetyl-CoA-carboxylase] ligase [Nitrospirae bacterium]|nr:biotin--[acetyl-CoA-carboxylase] ligase [Nitrospirota bacterium]